MLRRATIALAVITFFPTSAHPQQHDSASQTSEAPMKMATPMSAANLIEAQLNRTSSGTSIEPASTPVPMLMSSRGSWTLMLHGTAFVTATQQSGPRGADKLFSTNWIMSMAQRRLGPGQLTLRTMFSLEPATVSGRYYPLLFQQGETAFGKPIIDGQHPHNFFMEVGALYDIHLGERTLLSLYAAPVGDPAIGPTAYPHRLSASENPLAALGHHQQDSTHIAYNVLTAGLTLHTVRVEVSGFHGGEPSEQRWGFQPSANGHAIDSYSSRITFSPRPNWTAQYSIAHVTRPEALHGDEDQQRQTASIMYNRPIGAHHDTTSMPGMDMSTSATGNWSTTLIWGRTKSLTDHPSRQNSYLLESLLKFRKRNYAWTRIENAARTSELLLQPGSPLPPNFEESPIGHIAAYSFGYDRDYRITSHLLAAPGAQFTTYTTPTALISTYGRHPFGAGFFVRFRITQ
jgi:hypothetical protein